MKVTRTEQNIYTSVASNSVTFIECRYPQGLSTEIRDRLCFYNDKIPGIPCHLPIAYALKGNSLWIETMQQMIEHLRDHCDHFNIGVLCEIYDGQFLNLILQGDNLDNY